MARPFATIVALKMFFRNIKTAAGFLLKVARQCHKKPLKAV